MEAEQRKDVLEDVFAEQLIHWGLGATRADIQDVVDGLMANIDPHRSYGAPGRSKTSANVAEKHQKVFLHFFEMPQEQARALATALVMWEVITAVQHQNSDTEAIPLFTAAGLETARRHRFLFVNDEWLPRSGGITTFNSGLATALASVHHVGCLLPRASEQERDLAKEASVQLFESNPSKYLIDLSAQLLSHVSQDVRDFAPEFIIGHDRRTGAIALELKERHFKDAKVCVIAHTAPHVIEKFKTDRKGEDEIVANLTARSEYLASLLETADIAFAVGPRLQQQAKSVVRRECTVNHLTPGVDVRDTPAASGKNRFILLFGRAEDAVLKGVALADDVARTLKDKSRHSYIWNIRGIPNADFAKFLRRYPHFDLPQRYDADPEVLARTIERAELVLMPSLEEGFGLVALEALANNRPVLISAQSGVADYLRVNCPGFSDRFIVSTVDLSARVPDPDKVINNWSAAIENVFDNWDSTMGDVARIRDVLRSRGSWKSATIEFLAACFPA